jgi:hypothetical protein
MLLRFVDDLIEFQMRLLLCSLKHILEEQKTILSFSVPHLLAIADVSFVSFSQRSKFSPCIIEWIQAIGYAGKRARRAEEEKAVRNRAGYKIESGWY